ncbi:hypothetical protein ELI_3984 [Eubacterium callanderi]|uniref:Uncharacterized protein n=1 Tax=Eubacterium callanderi TaxID=53442 RepID=E3GGX3_9FIRM|nr:hypothetical protein ELI_3984 [Eubacterium callanderi]
MTSPATKKIKHKTEVSKQKLKSLKSPVPGVLRLLSLCY